MITTWRFASQASRLLPAESFRLRTPGLAFCIARSNRRRDVSYLKRKGNLPAAPALRPVGALHFGFSLMQTFDFATALDASLKAG